MAAIRRCSLRPPLRLTGERADEVQDELAQDRQVVGGMLGACPHLLVGKGHMHAAVHASLDPPVQADFWFMRCASDASLPNANNIDLVGLAQTGLAYLPE